MYKRIKVREILELLSKGYSGRMIEKVIQVSRNSVSRIYNICFETGLSYEELLRKEDDELYDLFFPNRFKEREICAHVDYSYVHDELKKTGVTLKLLWEEYRDDCLRGNTHPASYSKFTSGYREYTVKKSYTSHIEHKPGEVVEVDWSGPTMSYYDRHRKVKTKVYLFVGTLPYSQLSYVEACPSMDSYSWLRAHINMFYFFEGTPLRIVCDNLKTGVVTHPKYGDIILNDSYLSLAEHYNCAIFPTGVRKPKEKPSVEGTVGKISTAIIAKLRNEIYYSLDELNKGIKEALSYFNNKEFEKREGSRMSVFNMFEKPYLNKLPSIPYELKEYSYNHKVMANSHIYFKRNYYSVPYKYISKSVLVSFDRERLSIYYNGEKIATHLLFSPYIKGQYRTNSEHLNQDKAFKKYTVSEIVTKAKSIGDNTFTLIEKVFNYYKIKEQAITSTLSIVNLDRKYSKAQIEDASRKALEVYNIPTYKNIISIIDEKVSTNNIRNKKTKGLVRGSSYYKNEEK